MGREGSLVDDIFNFFGLDGRLLYLFIDDASSGESAERDMDKLAGL